MIEFTTSEAAIWALAFTLIGALIGALASIYSARLSAEKQQLYVESGKFIAEFINQIVELRKADEDAFKIINDEVLARQHRAKVRFESWVENRKLKAFHDAWYEYQTSLKTQSPGSLDRRKSECEAVLAQIDKVLSYARTKG